MKLFAITENGKKREVKAVHRCINGNPAKLKKGSPAWYEAVNETIRQGVCVIGT